MDILAYIYIALANEEALKEISKGRNSDRKEYSVSQGSIHLIRP